MSTLISDLNFIVFFYRLNTFLGLILAILVDLFLPWKCVCCQFKSFWQLQSRHIGHLYQILSCTPSPLAFLQSVSPPPSLDSTVLYHVPLLFVCLFKHRGKVLGWRPPHLFWSEGHVNRGAPVGPDGPWRHTPTPQTQSSSPLAGFYKERVLWVAHASRHWHARRRRGFDAWFKAVMWRHVDSLARRPWEGVAGGFSFNLYSCREGWRRTQNTDHTNWISLTSQQQLNICNLICQYFVLFLSSWKSLFYCFRLQNKNWSEICKN